jgi:hypothetical protein
MRLKTAIGEGLHFEKPKTFRRAHALRYILPPLPWLLRGIAHFDIAIEIRPLNIKKGRVRFTRPFFILIS